MAIKKRNDGAPTTQWWRRFLGPRPLWVVGIAFVAASALAWQAGRHALLDYARRGNLPVGVSFDQPDALLRVQILQGARDPSLWADASLITQAKKTLRREPLDVLGLQALAINADARRDGKAAVEFATLADQVTRRDRVSQLVLAKAAAEKSDDEAALAHLDIALSTTLNGRAQIYALMSQQARKPEARRSMQYLVSDQVEWMDDFLAYVLRDGADGSRNAASLLLGADPAKTAEIRSKIGGDLLGMLATYGHYDLLPSVYARLRGSGQDISRLATFDRATVGDNLGWLGWTSPADASFGAELDPAKDGITATVYSNQNESGVALRRVLMLAPGRYTLDEQREATFSGASSSARWKLSCATGATLRGIWQGPQQLVYSVAKGSGPVIPADCPIQMLELEVSGGNEPRGFEVVIHRFALRPAE